MNAQSHKTNEFEEFAVSSLSNFNRQSFKLFSNHIFRGRYKIGPDRPIEIKEQRNMGSWYAL